MNVLNLMNVKDRNFAPLESALCATVHTVIAMSMVIVKMPPIPARKGRRRRRKSRKENECLLEL